MQIETRWSRSFPSAAGCVLEKGGLWCWPMRRLWLLTCYHHHERVACPHVSGGACVLSHLTKVALRSFIFLPEKMRLGAELQNPKFQWEREFLKINGFQRGRGNVGKEDHADSQALCPLGVLEVTGLWFLSPQSCRMVTRKWMFQEVATVCSRPTPPAPASSWPRRSQSKWCYIPSWMCSSLCLWCWRLLCLCCLSWPCRHTPGTQHICRWP